MKKLLLFLIVFAVVGLGIYLLNNVLNKYDHPGYVIIGFAHWSMETTLVVFLTGLLLLFCFLYFFFRFLGWLVRFPGRLQQKRRNIKFNRSQEALISGLVDSAEGNWQKAEKVLIKHASNSGAPLIHYLTAARAAQSRGAFSKRDEYLKIAREQSPDSEVVVGLTQAELHLSENQFEQALESLTRVHSIDPSHASVLRLMHQTYKQLGDWEAIRKLIPSLNQNKVMMEAEVKLLEAETYSQLLKQSAKGKNAVETRALWEDIPEHIQAMHGIRAIYFAAMIEAGAGAQIEDDLMHAIIEKWDQTMLVLYGNVQSDDIPAQLKTAESWLVQHPGDVVLLRVLGKLSINCSDLERAEKYLAKSISIEPTVAAYQILGELLFEKGEKDKATECFKRGLELASEEVVSNAEAIAEND